MLLEELDDIEDLKGLTMCPMVDKMLSNGMTVRFKTLDAIGEPLRGFVVSLKPRPKNKSTPYEMRYREINERGEVDQDIEWNSISQYEMDHMMVVKEADDIRVLVFPNEEVDRNRRRTT